MSLPITSLLTGVFVIMMVILALQVSLCRQKLRVSLGDGNDEALRRKIRAHGNFAEYVPLALIGLALIESAGGSVQFVSKLAVALLTSRIIHAIGIVHFKAATPRVIAMVMQNTVFISMGIWLLASYLK